MNEITTIGLDLAKNVFQVHGVDATGAAVLRKRVRRGQVLAFFAGLPCCLVGIEACATAHYWARELRALGHEVRLMRPMPQRSARRCSARRCVSSRSRRPNSNRRC
jgi:transposase